MTLLRGLLCWVCLTWGSVQAADDKLLYLYNWSEYLP